MELKVPPVAKAFWKDWFALDANVNKLPPCAVEMAAPGTTKVDSVGAFCRISLARVAGMESPKMPPPARITVLLLANGLHVKPMRGCQTTMSVPG